MSSVFSAACFFMLLFCLSWLKGGGMNISWIFYELSSWKECGDSECHLTVLDVEGHFIVGSLCAGKCMGRCFTWQLLVWGDMNLNQYWYQYLWEGVNIRHLVLLLFFLVCAAVISTNARGPWEQHLNWPVSAESATICPLAASRGTCLSRVFPSFFYSCCSDAALSSLLCEALAPQTIKAA